MKYTSFKLSAYFAIFLSLISGVHASNRLTGQDLKDIIKQRAEHAGIELEAIIAAEKVFYPCEVDLQIVPKIRGSWKTVEVICPLPYPWKLNIRTEITSPKPENAKLRLKKQPNLQPPKKNKPTVAILKTKPLKTKERPVYSYVVLAESVHKGTVLNDKTMFDIKDYHYKVRGGFTDMDQIIGRKLKHSVSEGVPILARHLTKNYIVEKNTILDIILIRTGVKISGKGVALSNGQLGEIIIVSNVDSGVKLKARIKNSYEAEIIAKHSN